MRRGDDAAAAGRTDEALELYDLAAALAPGHGLPFTRRALAKFRAAFGAPRAPRERSGRAAVSMSLLGQYGQFGNQLLQYGFLRLYAQEHGLEAQAPDWIGRDLFDLDDPLPQPGLPLLEESQADLFASLRRETPVVHAGVDLKGYFCDRMARWGGRAGAFRALFAPSAKLRPLLERAAASLRRRGRTLVAVHIRRGNYGYGRFWIAPERWYAQWLGAAWPRLDAPVLYVASDDPNAAARLARFSPLTAAGLGADIPGAEFFLDHCVLREADQLAIANSTFSFTAALLNERAAAFLRPDPALRTLVPFEPWTSPVLVDAPAGATAQAELVRRLRPSDRVAYVGDFCSAWTNAARAAHPGLRVAEIDAESTIDEAWSRGEFDTADHLVIGEECDLQAVLDGGRESLDFGRITAVHYRAGADAAERAAASLRESGFAVRALEPGTYEAVLQ